MLLLRIILADDCHNYHLTAKIWRGQHGTVAGGGNSDTVLDVCRHYFYFDNNTLHSGISIHPDAVN